MDGIEINTQTPRQALGQVTDEVKNYLRFLSDMGCNGLACSEESMSTMAAWGVVKGRSAALKSGSSGNTALSVRSARPDMGSTDNRMKSEIPRPVSPVAEMRHGADSSWGAASNSWSSGADSQNRAPVPLRETPEMARGASDSWNSNSQVRNTAPDTLDRIRVDLEHCGRCGSSHGKKNLVVGSGNPNARLMFIGDAPGDDDDSQGMPFVGAPGQLLTKMLEAMTLSREDVYLCNLVKCKPYGNRNPSSEEISNCYHYLERQIRAVKPEVICTLGAFSTMAILGVNQGVAELRGRFQAYQSIKVMPTFHPVFLIKNPGRKKAAWEDLQKVMAALGIRR